jgi:hypothetical protein
VLKLFDVFLNFYYLSAPDSFLLLYSLLLLSFLWLHFVWMSHLFISILATLWCQVEFSGLCTPLAKLIPTELSVLHKRS